MAQVKLSRNPSESRSAKEWEAFAEEMVGPISENLPRVDWLDTRGSRLHVYVARQAMARQKVYNSGREEERGDHERRVGGGKSGKLDVEGR